MSNAYKTILIAIVDLLKEQGQAGAGEVDGLNAYQALLEAKIQAEAFGVPLKEIGLADFNLDDLINPPTTQPYESIDRQAASAEYVVLEEVLRRVMDDGLALAEKGKRSDREDGELYAYFTILDHAKQQAHLLGIQFADQELQAFDPYELLAKPIDRLAA